MKITSITGPMFEATYIRGYEMAKCAHCGESARTVGHMGKLECGATLRIPICKECSKLPSLNDNRPHVHVGEEVQAVRYSFPLDDHGAEWLARDIRAIALKQAAIAYTVGMDAVHMSNVTLPVKICSNGGAR